LINNMSLLQKTNNSFKQAISEKQDFMSAISHDLGAPLRNIQGMIDLLCREAGTYPISPNDARFKRIISNVERAQDLISDIINLSKIMTNRFPFEIVDIGAVIKSVLQELAFDLESRSITVMLPEAAPVLYCEKNMITHIFRNLIDNAIKYSKTSERPKIEIDYKKEENRHLFLIKDNGIGISEENHHRIFYPFRRVNSQQTLNIPGKGLGLSVARIIVQNYNGTIWVKSEENKGAAFFFALSKEKTDLPKIHGNV
ncbi:MAG: HAMP domain-containing sensor histidine kinase, partial [bacterium]